MSTVLVTGANGFVNLNIVRRLAQKGARVVALARRPPDPETVRFLAAETAQVVWVEGDVRDRAGLIELARTYGVDCIVHGAAITPSREVERAQAATVVDVNLGGTLNALEAAREVGARRFVLISSTGVYGAPANPHRRLAEDEPLQVSNLYTICKIAGENLSRRYDELYEGSFVVGRLGSAYGPMERASHSRETMSMIYEFAHRALAGDHVRIWGAERLRDFCYIEDVAEAFARLALADRLRWTIYNAATDRFVTVRDALETLVRLCPGFGWSEAADREAADVAVLPSQERAPLDLSRLQEDVGFAPIHDLASGLRAYLAWLRAGWAHI
ncbi:MAG: NAD(P)-dependent oxidoreductase [Ardenticatenaceae bacterium]|nr:NAD(P)-dependent oxidoreductase [Ardenticatenaceae bacterium]